MSVHEFDVVIIGSGFGGSVSAMRLTEKGYHVAVLEAGKRFEDQSFPKNSWHLKNYLFFPALKCFGIQRLSLLKDAFILSGAGVGGGSLVYGNTLYEPMERFYQDKQWAQITDWKAELAPYYHQAKRMLGVVENPVMTPSDEVMLDVAKEMGVADTFKMTPVGVYFGKPGVEVSDPFFGGKGPRRRGCQLTGECMTGCRHNAKNTLMKNYLYLAEKAGAKIFPLTTVYEVSELEDGRFLVKAKSTDKIFSSNTSFIASDVIFAAGTLGTQKLLHRMKDKGLLPKISSKLGELSRTNSEAILGARTFRKNVDFTRGVAITSSFHPDDFTHIEPVRYGKKSNAMGILGTILTDGDQGPRPLIWLKEFFRHPASVLRNLFLRKWSEQTVIALVMQSFDNSITLYTKRTLFGRKLTSKQGVGEPNPVWIPGAHKAVRLMAKRIQGIAFGAWNDVFNIPMTAHFLGGVVIGDSDKTGVIDPYQRIYHYPHLHVVDGSAITANLGVNPSLTITAQAERAMSYWPNKGEADPRPGQDVYRRISPVYPKSPIVPDDAPGALRF